MRRGRGPALHSVLEINPDALVDRRRARRRAQGGQGCAGRSTAFPVLIKDNIDTARPHEDDRRLARARRRAAPRPTRLVVEAPARGRRGHPRQDQPLASGPTSARRTRPAAGAAAAARRGTPTRSTATRRGSSSGSGAAAAANLCAVAVGTETDGSIVSPSNNCGARRHQADASASSAAPGIIPISHTPGHRRADGAHRRRRGDPARRDGRAPTPADAATRRPRRGTPAARLHDGRSTPTGLAGRAHRRAAQEAASATAPAADALVEAALVEL